jgi:chromate reductase
MVVETHRTLLISGSLRAQSTNTAVLRTVQAVAPTQLDVLLYAGLGGLPHFNPDDDPDGGPVDAAVAELRAQIGAAQAVIFSTPEYAGALPGSFKNLLDWTVGGGETYGKPVAWINVSGVASPTGAADAHDSLRKVLGYTGAEIVEPACVRLPLSRAAIGPDGLVADPGIRTRLSETLDTLLAHLRGAD